MHLLKLKLLKSSVIGLCGKEHLWLEYWIGIVEIVTEKSENVTETHITGNFHKESIEKYTFIAGVMAEVFWLILYISLMQPLKCQK